MGLLRKRLTLVEQLARQTGWPVSNHCGDVYTVQSPDREQHRHINIRHAEKEGFVRFSADFPIRFSLDKTPQGLFARMLLRSISLRRSHWVMDIEASCEAQPYLFGQWPVSIMTPAFFNAVCQEMVGEIRSFHQELRDKFNYAGGYGGGGAGVPPTGRAGVPGVKIDNRGMQFLE